MHAMNEADPAASGGAAGEPQPFREAEISGMRTFWQRPRGDTAPQALLFLAHGACHGAEDFFEEPGYKGLPVEHRIVEAALDRGYLVVASSSMDRARKAWRPNVDGPRVAEVLREVLRREALSPECPICALGASNGGAFVLLLPDWVRLRAVVCQIMAIPGEALALVRDLPPVLFVHMPRDRRTATGVAASVRELRAMGRVALERRCEPKQIGPSFFTEHCGIEGPISAHMAEAFRTAGFIDGQGELLEDPRRTDWRSVLEPFARALGDSLCADRSPISEVMNVAWGTHEITAEGIEEALEFCEREGVLGRREGVKG